MSEPERDPSLTSEVSELVRDAAEEIKPKLRGWLHAATWPLALAAFIVLIALSPGWELKVAAAVFMASALLLFGVSAVYHAGRWSPNVHHRLKRFDHANIFLLIAGSYTPFTVLLLDRSDAKILLLLVWCGAILGVAFRVFWLDAPRWLYVPIYLAMGWAAVFWTADFAAAASPAVLVCIVAGGLLYTIGGVVYAFEKPDPFPRWFGFHEIFHSFTIVAFATHYVGVSIAAYSLR